MPMLETWGGGHRKEGGAAIAEGRQRVGQAGRQDGCGGIGHLIRVCPSVNQEREENDAPAAEGGDAHEQHFSLHITLIASRSSKLLHEALGKGVLDTGCSKTVAGEVWYVEYLSTLSVEDRNHVKRGAKYFSVPVWRWEGDGES